MNWIKIKQAPRQFQKAFAKTVIMPRPVLYPEEERAYGIAMNINRISNQTINDMMISKLFTKGKRPKNGKWREFNKSAVLIAEGVYHNDLKHGIWKEYYDTGQLMIVENYWMGLQHGSYTSYLPNGQLFSEGKYYHGRREGYFNVYDENGQPVKTLLFINNNQIEELDETPKATESSQAQIDYITPGIVIFYWLAAFLQPVLMNQ